MHVPSLCAQVFMLPTDAVLDENTLTAIMASGGGVGAAAGLAPL